MGTNTAEAISAYESILSDPGNVMRSSDNPSPEDNRLLSKPSLSYIALIAKVILSSPSQKLKLASIYRAMEEQFPFLGSRGPGWRNSVRHNLSVNDCFVKVSRCEDGRGHYWGVHQAHLREFKQGNFRQCRRVRGRRDKERYNEVARCLSWIETNCFLERFYWSRCLACVDPQCPLQEPTRYQLSSSHWTQPCHQPWSVSVDWVQIPGWMKHFNFPERPPDLYGRATAGRGHECQPLTSRLHRWETNDTALTGMKESYDSRFMTPTAQAFRFPGCWCMSPVIKEFKKLSPYKVHL